MEDSSSQSFFRKHWEGYKEFWSDRFSILDNYSPYVQRQTPLPSWSSSDVEEFIASDPVHGPVVIHPSLLFLFCFFYFFYCLLLSWCHSVFHIISVVFFLSILRFVYLKLNVFNNSGVYFSFELGMIWNFLAQWVLIPDGLSYNIA